MFSERPAGQAQAIKSWFYPDDRIGQEFVYPKSQAMKIAKENHAGVLSYTEDSVKNNDTAALHSAKIGRIDENGQPVAENKAADSHANDNAANQASAATHAPTTAPPAATTAADNDDAASSSTTRAGATTARADASQNNSNAPAPATSANRTHSSPAVGTTAQSTTAPRSSRAVGTSGTTADPQTQNNADRTLPKTASPLASIELLSALSLLGALGVHQLRKQTGESRG
jgi:hypothetical protein